jgi:Raf kinase inhibitor-like YbhB/YbcL family protein
MNTAPFSLTMKRGIKILVVCILSIFLFSACTPEHQSTTQQSQQETQQPTQTSSGGTMKITSSAFEQNGQIPSKYTCDGSNFSPPLTFTGIPANAQSLVFIVDDPDAMKPAGKVWDHWVLFNIPPTTTEIREATQPGKSGSNSKPALGYQGPCPPDGEHRYFFKLYALDVAELNLKVGATKAEVEAAMNGHVIAQAELVGRYVRE